MSSDRLPPFDIKFSAPEGDVENARALATKTQREASGFIERFNIYFDAVE